MREADGDADRARHLYLWHAELSSGVMEVAHHFEVLLRNAIDRELGVGEPDEPVSETWLLDPLILDPHGIARVEEVITRLKRENKRVTRGRVVAGLSYGFWVNLFAARYESLWRTRLAIVFPGAGLRRNVHARLELFQRLRNRVAHHDNILFQPVESIHTGMVEVAGYIDPDAPAFFRVISRVPKLLATKP